MRIGPMLQPLLPYTPERDVYRLLGVPSSASTEEISVACRRLARTFHPDHNRSERATAEMQVVNVVRRVMSDPDMRARYDRERWRFHATEARPAASRMAIPPSIVVRDVPRRSVTPLEPSPVTRYLRAALVGMRAAVAGLWPSRCASCWTVTSGEDAFCVACGTPRLTGG